MLDTMGKKRIQVWINSPGGIVMDGYNIFNAILKSNTPVDTYNIGIAASIAGVIFMAGRKRVMSDYSCLMIHSPHGGSDKKQMDAIAESLTKMLAAKSNLSELDVKYLMDRTTWINSAECFAKGFCSEIEVTSENNKKRMAQASNVNESWKIANSIKNFNQTIIKKSVMTKITMKLGLNDAATEDNVISAIKEIEDKAYADGVAKISAENKLKEIENSFKIEKDSFQAKITEVENSMATQADSLTKLQASYDAMVTEKENSEKAANSIKAKNMVEGFAKAGRIKNEAAVIEKWSNLAESDFDGTKLLMEGLPLNKTAVDLGVDASAAAQEKHVGDYMAEKLKAIKNKK
jgi:ATP-dependent Clp protease protease subunit